MAIAHDEAVRIEMLVVSHPQSRRYLSGHCQSVISSIVYHARRPDIDRIAFPRYPSHARRADCGIKKRSKRFTRFSKSGSQPWALRFQSQSLPERHRLTQRARPT